MMRVTFNTVHGGVYHLNAAASQAERARQQIESGKRLQVASDDPSAMRRAVAGRAELAGLDTYARTADAATARLATLDSVLSDIVERLTQATVAATSARGTTATVESREASALALEGLRDDLVADVNVTFRGTYLFGGSRSQTPPYVQVAGAWTYQGDAAPVEVDLGQGRTVQIARDGQAVAQGTDATDVFSELDALIVAVRAGDNAGIGVGIDALGRAFNRAVRAQSHIGVDQNGVAERQLQLTSSRLAALANVAKDEDADLVAAISEMNRAQVAYRAALGAIGTAANAPSLMDYLR
jgi:flagellar hook-associated protein 3 FlgL